MADLTHPKQREREQRERTQVARSVRVLIVRTGAMGDVLHAMPAVAALRRLQPTWEIYWAIEPRWSALLMAAGYDPAQGRGPAMPLVDGWFAVNIGAWKRGPLGATVADIRALRRRLRAKRFDLAVDMQGLIRSSVVGRMAGAEHFAGRAEPRERVARLLYDTRVPVQVTHVVEQGCELLGSAVESALGPVGFAPELRRMLEERQPRVLEENQPHSPGTIALPVDAAAEAWCDGVVPAGQRFVWIAPTAGWGAKAWPAARYGAVAAALGRAGYAVLVNAAPSADGRGDATARAVVAASGGAATTVVCSIAQMMVLIRRASLVMAGDSGPLHMAAELGRPVVGLFGPTDPARTGPYGAGTRSPGMVLRHASSVTSHARRSEPEAGLLRIEVDEVVGAALEVLQQAGV